MKANELMIGDWVLYDGEPYQIRQLGIYGVDRDGEDYPAVCVGKPKGIGLIVERNEIAPIPLTPEILEKNGFEKTASPKRYVFEQNNNRIIVDLKDDYLLQIIYNFSEYAPYTNYVLPHVDYVHQLQHALRLCGIEKEIEL